MNCKPSPGQTKSFRNYARYNSLAFCKDLQEMNWQKEMNLTLPESQNGDLNTIDRMWLDYKSAYILLLIVVLPYY